MTNNTMTIKERIAYYTNQVLLNRATGDNWAAEMAQHQLDEARALARAA